MKTNSPNLVSPYRHWHSTRQSVEAPSYYVVERIVTQQPIRTENPRLLWTLPSDSGLRLEPNAGGLSLEMPWRGNTGWSPDRKLHPTWCEGKKQTNKTKKKPPNPSVRVASKIDFSLMPEPNYPVQFLVFARYPLCLETEL